MIASTSGGTELSSDESWLEAKVGQPAPLEYRDDAAVGGGDRQHGHQHALERQEHRPDRDQQHHERDERHEEEHPRLGLRHPVVEVLDQRGRSADVDAGALRARTPAAAARASSRWSRGRDMSSGSTDITADNSALLLSSPNAGGCTVTMLGASLMRIPTASMTCCVLGAGRVAVGERRPARGSGRAHRAPAPRRPR